MKVTFSLLRLNGAEKNLNRSREAHEEELGYPPEAGEKSLLCVLCDFCSNSSFWFRQHRACSLLALVLGLGSAQLEAATLSSDEAVRLAVAHSPSLKSHDQDIQAASARRLQAEAGLMPQLDTRIQANHYEGLENQALGPVSIPVIDNQLSASIGITQPLYTGGRVTQQKLSTRLSEDAARHSLSASTADVTLQTLNAYWSWSKAVEQAEALQAAVVRMKALAADTRNFEKAGLATDNDRLAVEVSLDQTQLQLDDAVLKAGVSRVELARLTGRELDATVLPQKPVLPPDSLKAPALDDLLRLAFTNREDLVALRLSARAGTALVEAARAEARPQLALIARYEQGRPNQRDFPPDDQWRDDAVIGAAVTWNLFDGGLTRSRTSEAQARATREALLLQAAEESVASQVQVAGLILNHSRGQLQTAMHAEAGARRNLEVTTDLWKNGVARHSEVLEAQSKLTSTTAQRIAAEADIILARAALDHATGEIK